MRLPKKIIFFILKYQIRTLSFIAPIALVPSSFIKQAFNINVILSLFILLQTPFIMPSVYYGMPTTFNTYFDFTRVKRNALFAVTTILWFNFFYFLGLGLVYVIYGIASNKGVFEFEILLLAAIVIGFIINTFLLKEKENFDAVIFLGRIIFTTTITLIYFMIHPLFK